jgi:hypothetical protein
VAVETETTVTKDGTSLDDDAAEYLNQTEGYFECPKFTGSITGLKSVL